MISFSPAVEMVRSRLGRPPADVTSRAVERWEIAPASTLAVRSAIYLPGQIDKIERTEFASLDVVVQSLTASFEVTEGPTEVFRLRDVDLFDGVLYAGSAARHLRKRDRKAPAHFRLTEIDAGAMFETYLGNRWFGNWLAEDCLAYPLAAGLGRPVTTAAEPHGRHVVAYERMLAMAPERVTNAHFRDLVVVDDRANNASKAARIRSTRDTLIGGRPIRSHAGVFLLRGETGDRRVLANERELADTLAKARGFTILDPNAASVPDLVDACAGARVVAGVEGSHLVHGLMAMAADATLFVVQPPQRVTTALKIFTDRVGQRYAFVVAEGTDRLFRIAVDDVQRTLDLCRD